MTNPDPMENVECLFYVQPVYNLHNINIRKVRVLRKASKTSFLVQDLEGGSEPYLTDAKYLRATESEAFELFRAHILAFVKKVRYIYNQVAEQYRRPERENNGGK